jgi:hypothetical protein
MKGKDGFRDGELNNFSFFAGEGKKYPQRNKKK